MKPQPYLYPAAQATNKLAAKRMARSFRMFIKKIGGGEINGIFSFDLAVFTPADNP